jgi:predicted site-specific integrase-resolvase
MPDNTKQVALLTGTEVGRLLNVDVATVRRWADAGLIEVIRLPSGVRRYPSTSVDAVLNTKTGRAAS